MEILGFSREKLTESGGIDTASEISQQPELWMRVLDKYASVYYPLNDFLNRAFQESDRVILTGAGSSAFIGIALQGVFAIHRKKCVFAVPTTELITHPESHFSRESTILMVSFARSGNSPESLGAVRLADRHCRKVFHLIISCAEDGKLARFETSSPKYAFLLPPEANDRGLAMTSSFTGMLLAGVLIAEKRMLSEQRQYVQHLAETGRNLIQSGIKKLQILAKDSFERAVFLGSGNLEGIARESHLKLQELTDGQVVCAYDTFLGFRHGPKAVVNEKTIMVYLFSSDPRVYRYEKDLVESMKEGRVPAMQIAVGGQEDDLREMSITLHYTTFEKPLPDTYLMICAVIPAQLIGFYKSLELGLDPDSPSKSGAINRVVQGVTVYLDN